VPRCQYFSGALEVNVEEVHDKVNSTATASVGTHVPKLWPCTQDLEFFAINLQMPARRARIATSNVRLIFLGVSG
jgi:hypothetical protein